MTPTKFILLILIGLMITESYGQGSLGEYMPGMVILKSGDSTKGFIKYTSKVARASMLKFKKEVDSKPIELTPYNVKAYVISGKYYVSKNVDGAESIDRKFVEPIVSGELSLYGSWTYNYAQYVPTEVELYYFELNGRELVRVKKTNFRKTIGDYLKSNPTLSLKILDGKLRSWDLEQIANEYNLWYQNGGIDGEDLGKTQDVDKKLREISDSKLAIELPVTISKSLILLESRLKNYLEVEDAVSYDLGMGLRIATSDAIRVRFGSHFWVFPMIASYEATGRDSNGNEVTINVEEKGKIRNIGLYFHVTYEGLSAFAGGGLSAGISNKYKTKFSYYTQTGTLLFSESSEESLLTNKFYNQIHLDFLGGFKVKTKTSLTIKPYIKVSLPLSPIYDSGAPPNTAYDMYAGFVNIGLILDLGLLYK
jgi:hypothetical protein